MSALRIQANGKFLSVTMSYAAGAAREVHNQRCPEKKDQISMKFMMRGSQAKTGEACFAIARRGAISTEQLKQKKETYFLKLNLKEILSTKIDLEKMAPQQLVYRVLPHFLLEIMTKYFRLEIEGLEHLPTKGPALIAPNHSGYLGLDAILLSHHIQKKTKRVPRVLTHALWFITKGTSIPMNKMGFIEATTPNGIKYLNQKQLVVLFPEGEHGNFKASKNAYKLQEFKRGFIRMALKTGAPIIPCLIIGAEETHINIAKLKLGKYLKGTVLPLPLNTLPLPAKWKIIFFEPIHLPYKKDKVDDQELVHELALDIREKMQKELSKNVKNRKNIFL